MKKLLLGLGTLATMAAPVAAAVACSSWNNMEIKDLKGATTLAITDFIAKVKDENLRIQDLPTELNLLNAKVAIEDAEAKLVKAAEEVRAKNAAADLASKVKTQDQINAEKTAFDKKNKDDRIKRLNAVIKEVDALVAKSSRGDALKTSIKAGVDAAVSVNALRDSIKGMIHNTDALKTLLGLAGQNVFVKNDDGSISDVISLAYEAESKTLIVVTKFINEYNTVNMTHKVVITFPGVKTTK